MLMGGFIRLWGSQSIPVPLSKFAATTTNTPVPSNVYQLLSHSVILMILVTFAPFTYLYDFSII